MTQSIPAIETVKMWTGADQFGIGAVTVIVTTLPVYDGDCKGEGTQATSSLCHRLASLLCAWQEVGVVPGV